MAMRMFNDAQDQLQKLPEAQKQFFLEVEKSCHELGYGRDEATEMARELLVASFDLDNEQYY